MPSFTVNNTARTPFGKNQYLRSTRGLGFESYTLAASTVPTVTIDTFTEQFLEAGTVLAKITSGTDIGKIGPFDPGLVVTESVVIASTATAGTFTLTFDGETTTAIAYNATAAAIKTALQALSTINAGDVLVTGGALPTSVTVTFAGRFAGQNAPNLTLTATVTGGTTTATITAGTEIGTGQATDGRELASNIVGILETFLPWQLKYRDVEVAVLYRGAVVQANCLEMNSAGTFVALTDGTKAKFLSRSDLAITFH